MPDLIVGSLRGGMNNSDPPTSIPDDQAVLCQNTECQDSMLGERRRGTDAIDLSASISSRDRVSFLARHLPTSDDTASELWALGVTGTASYALVRKTTSWSDVTMTDTATLTGLYPYQWQAQSLHGKLFIAYKSSVDRMHVVDASAVTVRRAGVSTPTTPTGANDGGVGTFTGTRYYRVRVTTQVSGTTVNRSEPSDVLTFAPNGNDTGIIVTRGTIPGDGETHWELEASIDNANFYRIATIAAATTTSTDTQDYVTGYGAFTLSEGSGDYSLLRSARYLTADQDRLLLGGSYETAAHASRVTWTPVLNAPGVGNDERFKLDTDPYLDLDGYEGGPLTGLSAPVSGSVWAFKFSHIYKLVRTGLRATAYEAIAISKDRGALHGSVVAGVDQTGRACLYFLDPAVGPCRLGANGLEACGADILATWRTLNLEATKVVCCGLYYPENRQMIWNLAADGSNTPTVSIVLQTNDVRSGDDGARRGWSIWTGNRAKGLAMTLYADNIDANTARSRTLVPFIGLEALGLVHRCDTGNTDNGVAYSARIVTKPYTLANIMHTFAVRAGALLARAVTGAVVDVKVIRDFGLETTATVSGVTFDATASETQVVKVLDNLAGSELRVAQFEFVDPTVAGTRFELNQLCLIETANQGD